MATPYSTLLYQGEVPSPSPGVVFTVPEGYVCILRDLDAVGPGTSPWVLISEAVANQNFASVPAEQNGSSDNWSYTWRGRQVFDAGQEIQLGSEFDLIFARLSGYLLVAP